MIVKEMSRRFGFRPRTAWRHAWGWTQRKLAEEYNRQFPDARMSHRRVSAYERWPFGGQPPSLTYLVNLARLCGCTPTDLIDLDDLENLNPQTRRELTTERTAGGH